MPVVPLASSVPVMLALSLPSSPPLFTMLASNSPKIRIIIKNSVQIWLAEFKQTNSLLETIEFLEIYVNHENSEKNIKDAFEINQQIIDKSTSLLSYEKDKENMQKISYCYYRFFKKMYLHNVELRKTLYKLLQKYYQEFGVRIDYDRSIGGYVLRNYQESEVKCPVLDYHMKTCYPVLSSRTVFSVQDMLSLSLS